MGCGTQMKVQLGRPLRASGRSGGRWSRQAVSRTQWGGVHYLIFVLWTLYVQTGGTGVLCGNLVILLVKKMCSMNK